jgi:hypothetical protein
MEAIVQTILAKMGKVRKPELTALTALFTTILTVCGKVNFTNLSRYSDRNEKTFRRQFSNLLNFLSFSQAFIEIEIPESHPVLSILDASHVGKRGKKTFGLDHFYSGSHLRVVDQIIRHPNVYADTSGVRRFDYLEQAVKRGGAHKVLFGSDGPWLHPGLELYKIRLLRLSSPDEALILGGNLLRLIRCVVRRRLTRQEKW